MDDNLNTDWSKYCNYCFIDVAHAETDTKSILSHGSIVSIKEYNLKGNLKCILPGKYVTENLKTPFIS